MRHEILQLTVKYESIKGSKIKNTEKIDAITVLKYKIEREILYLNNNSTYGDAVYMVQLEDLKLKVTSYVRALKGERFGIITKTKTIVK